MDGSVIPAPIGGHESAPGRAPFLSLKAPRGEFLGVTSSCLIPDLLRPGQACYNGGLH
jgi:hypothetical protein